jgi:hypothetical protein
MLLLKADDALNTVLNTKLPYAFIGVLDKDVQSFVSGARQEGFGIVALKGKWTDSNEGDTIIMLTADNIGQLRHFLKDGLSLLRFALLSQTPVESNRVVLGNREFEIEASFVPASWNIGLAHSQGADVGETFV